MPQTYNPDDPFGILNIGMPDAYNFDFLSNTGIPTNPTGMPEAGQPSSFMDSLTTPQNMVGGLQPLGGLANAYTGMQNYGLAKDTLNQNLAITNTNLANQANLTNSQLRDRQTVRNRDNPSTMSTEEYMRQYGVSGNPIG